MKNFSSIFTVILSVALLASCSDKNPKQNKIDPTIKKRLTELDATHSLIDGQTKTTFAFSYDDSNGGLISKITETDNDEPPVSTYTFRYDASGTPQGYVLKTPVATITTTFEYNADGTIAATTTRDGSSTVDLLEVKNDKITMLYSRQEPVSGSFSSSEGYTYDNASKNITHVEGDLNSPDEIAISYDSSQYAPFANMKTPQWLLFYAMYGKINYYFMGQNAPTKIVLTTTDDNGKDVDFDTNISSTYLEGGYMETCNASTIIDHTSLIDSYTFKYEDLK